MSVELEVKPRNQSIELLPYIENVRKFLSCHLDSVLEFEVYNRNRDRPIELQLNLDSDFYLKCGDAEVLVLMYDTPDVSMVPKRHRAEEYEGIFISFSPNRDRTSWTLAFALSYVLAVNEGAAIYDASCLLGFSTDIVDPTQIYTGLLEGKRFKNLNEMGNALFPDQFVS